MKRMQDFYQWLSSVRETTAPERSRFVALTRLGRTQLANMTSAGTWFIWNAEQPNTMA